MSMSIAERTVIGSAIEEAMELLPLGWGVSVNVCRGYVSVSLTDSQFEGRPFRKTSMVLQDQIRDAVQWAIKLSEEEEL